MPWISRAKSAVVAAVALLVLAACSDTPMDVETPLDDEPLGTLAYLQANPDAGVLPDWFQPQAYYATGDVVRTITGGGASCSVNTGIAFDGENLIMSCWYRESFDVLDRATGALIETIAVDGPGTGYGALAWDNGTKTLWACALHDDVVQIDLETGTILSSFVATGNCTDGLAFDGVDNIILTSGDVRSDVYSWETDGTPLGSANVSGILGGGNSGIAVGGKKVYLASNPTPRIFELERDFSSGTLFASVPRRVEDLECDDVTFAPDNAVIWQQDAYDRIIQAFEIPPGACPFGGGPVQLEVEVRPTNVSLTQSRMVQVYLQGTPDFDASTAEAADARLVVDGAGAGAPVYSIGARYYAASRDFDGDGDMDQMFYFSVSDLVAAGLTTGMTTLQLQDNTGDVQYAGNPVSLPTIHP